MKRNTLFTLILIAILYSCGGKKTENTAEEKQKLSEVLNKHYEAMQSNKWKDIETVALKMTMSSNGQLGEMSIAMDMKVKLPDKLYGVVTVNGEEVTMITNGDEGITRMGGFSTPMSAADVADLKDNLILEGELYRYEEKGHKIVYQEERTVNGTKYHVLDAKLKGKENYDIEMFINAETYLLDMMELSGEEQGQHIDMTMNMDNYEVVDGINVVSDISCYMNGNKVMSINLSDMSFNVTIDDEVFDLEQYSDSDYSIDLDDLDDIDEELGLE